MRSPATTRFIALVATLALVATGGCGKETPKDSKEQAKAAAGEAEKKAEQAEADKEGEAGEEGEKEAGKKADKAEPTGPTWDEIRAERNKPPAGLSAAPADATKEKSGLAWKRVTEGKGKIKPSGDDIVFVWYTHWKPDGKRVGTTFKLKRSKPRQLTLRTLIPGWKQALSDMVVGERRVLWLPPKLAYLSRANRKKGARVLDLELVKVNVAPKAPADNRKPPKDATKTGSGLVYKVLAPGKGTKKPGANSMVVAKYAGWKKDGTCFDFTAGDETRSFNLGSVIKGWTEGVQLMVAGQKNRFWIPGKLAYDGMNGKPQGQLTFDVELVDVDPKPKK